VSAGEKQPGRADRSQHIGDWRHGQRQFGDDVALGKAENAKNQKRDGYQDDQPARGPERKPALVQSQERRVGDGKKERWDSQAEIAGGGRERVDLRVGIFA
jgi:hypothetical protein